MENGKFLIFHRGKTLLLSQKSKGMRKDPALASFAQTLEINPNLKSDSVFLRVSADEGPLFATQIADSIDIVDIERRLDANFVDMRAAMFLVGEAKWAQFLCQAHSLLGWNRRTKFCSSCGSSTLSRNASGGQKDCSSCHTVHYPVTSPVAIVLLTTPSHSKAVLIRQPRYPPGMFSCVAGFV